MRFGITGATGHYGGQVVEALIELGVAPDDIVATGRDASKLAALTDLGVRATAADYDDRAALDRAFTGVDSVLLVSGADPGARVVQHENVIAAASEAGVGFLAYTSVLRADDTPLMLAPDHKVTEAAIRASGLPYTFLRHGWYSENYVQPAADAIATGVLRAATGSGRVSSASRRDLAEAGARVLVERGHDGAALELVGDQSWTLGELAAVASTIGGRPVEFAGLTADELRETLLGFGLDDGLVGFLVALDVQISEGLLESDSRDLSAILGRPTERLETTLARELAEQGAE
ncbi:MAG TPA: SDR family oxidoreductase [Microbacteriaceae bacterium]|nr:SDR family oxidoreductase [Microbacteriaceae bacterium]